MDNKDLSYDFYKFITSCGYKVIRQVCFVSIRFESWFMI